MFFNNSFRLVAHRGQKSGDREREEGGRRLRAGSLDHSHAQKPTPWVLFKQRNDGRV